MKKSRDRAWRRSQSRRIQEKRYQNWNKVRSYTWTDEPRRYGMFRKTNFSCGCHMCKPWKFGLESKYTHSQIKKLK